MIKNIDEFTFVCRSWSTSRSWGHEVELYENGNKLDKARITYINRTWESYQYQSCMRKVVSQVINRVKTRICDDYKAENNVKRLSKKKCDEILAQDKYYQHLNLLYTRL